MNLKSIVIIGTIEEALLEFKGASANFPVLTAKLGIGEKFFTVSARGDNALTANVVLGSLPIGSRVRVTAQVIGRRYNDSVITDFDITSVAPDFGGTNAASGVLTGYVKGVTDVPKKSGDGTFAVPKLGVLMVDRDGVIPDAELEIRFPRDGGDAAVEDWKAHIGDYVELQVDLDAFITQSGRSRPNFTAKKVSYFPFPVELREPLGLSEEVSPEDDLI